MAGLMNGRRFEERFSAHKVRGPRPAQADPGLILSKFVDCPSACLDVAQNFPGNFLARPGH